MNIEQEQLADAVSTALTSSLIRFSTISVLVLICLWAFSPFLPIMLWALVLAIALYPLYRPLKRTMGGSGGRAAGLIVLVGMLLIGVPTVMMASAFAAQLLEVAQNFTEGRVILPKPGPELADLPLVGDRLFETWTTAANDLPGFLERLGPQLTSAGKWAAGVAAGTAGSVFGLIGALIVTGIMLAWSDQGSQAMGRVFIRFAGPEKGLPLQELTTKTVRSVAVGIIGTACITAFVLGIVLFFAGVPAAGILAVVALIVGIMQLPVALVALVGIVYLWTGDTSTLYNTVFTVLLLAASSIDNVIKPMLLGRGVDVPMPVVLIGALGGMMSGGILGMFIGAAFLSAGYQIFTGWVDAGVSGHGTEDVVESVPE